MMLQLQLSNWQGKITRDQLVAHAFLLLVASNATGEWTAALKVGCTWCKLLFTRYPLYRPVAAAASASTSHLPAASQMLQQWLMPPESVDACWVMWFLLLLLLPCSCQHDQSGCGLSAATPRPTEGPQAGE